MSSAQIAVVGAGIAGLVATAHLAAGGLEPVVFEASTQMGGRARTRNVSGFHLNQGPHALYKGGALNAALQMFRIRVSGGSPDLASGWALWDSRRSRLPLARLERGVDALDHVNQAALRAFFERIADVSAFPPGMALQTALASLPVPARTVVEALVRLTTYVHAPQDLDAKAAFGQLRLSQSGAIYVAGGWSTIVDGLLSFAILAKAQVRTQEHVERLQFRNGKCIVHLRSGRSDEFAAVILAVSPQQARAIVDSSQLAAREATMRPVRVMCLDLALSKLPCEHANFALGMEKPTYFSVHSAVSNLAPHACALVHVARYLAPAEKPCIHHFDELENVADELQPGWRDYVVNKQRLAGMTVAHDFPRVADASRRAATPAIDVPGVFVAGDWVGPAGMLADAAAASARAAAERVIEFVAA